MKITIPAEEFRKAALKKRGGRPDEAEGSRKKPRSRSPLTPQAASQPSTQTPAPLPSPASLAPTPPRRSPTPVPPPRSPTPPTGQVAEAQPEGRRTPVVVPTTGSAPGEVPSVCPAVPTEKGKKTVGDQADRGAAAEPSRGKIGPIPSRPSVMNHPHLADKLLSAASCSAIREEMKRTHSRVIYREGETALLRVVNTFKHALAHVANEERRVERFRREALENKDRAVKAEDALKFAEAGEAERHAIVRAQARAEASAAHQQMRSMLDRALTAEGMLAEARAQLEAVKSDLKSAEERTEIAEEVARLADIRAAEATEAVKAADRKIAEAAEATKAAARAAEERMSEVAREAVESYRHSQTFIEEVAEAGADAYLHGFYYCREEAARISGIEGLRELEPDSGNQDAGEADRDAAPTDCAAPRSGPTPPRD